MEEVEWEPYVLHVEFPRSVSFLVLVLLIACPIIMTMGRQRHLHHSRGAGRDIQQEKEKFDMHGEAVDVLIIGGGLGGLPLAVSLSKLNVHCLVVA